MEKQDRDAADCARTLTDALNRKAKGSGVEKWEKPRRKLKKELRRAQRAIRVEESEMTGFTSKSPYHESDSEEEDEGSDEQHLEE